jgi:hypothetical protein
MKNPIIMIAKAQEEGQPTFTLLAQDKHSIVAINSYFQSVWDDPEISEKFKNDILRINNAFEIWQSNNANQVKLPD